MLDRVDQANPLRLAEQELGRQRAQAEVERTRANPDWVLQVGVKRDAQLGRNQPMVGVALPLALWDRNQGAHTAALRQVDKAEASLDATWPLTSPGVPSIRMLHNHFIVFDKAQLAAAPLAMHVPLAALAAILMGVAIRMGDCRAFVTLRRHSTPRNIIMLVTFALTVILDITTAVQVGVLCTMVMLIQRMTQVTSIYREAAASVQNHAGVRVLHVTGILFFGTADKLDDIELDATARVLVLNLTRVAYLDTTALYSLEALAERVCQNGGALVLAAAQRQPLRLMLLSGLIQKLGRENVKVSLENARSRAAELAQSGSLPQAEARA